MKTGWIYPATIWALVFVALGFLGHFMLRAQAASHGVALTWTQSTDPTTANTVYRSQVSGGPYTSIFKSNVPITSYADSTVSGGQTYFYVVTASNGTAESAFSNEVKAVIPQAAPTGLTVTVQ